MPLRTLFSILLLSSLLCACVAQPSCGAPATPFLPAGCPPGPPADVPVCVPPSDAAVQGLLTSFPNCAPLLSHLAATGEGVWLPADPTNSSADAVWPIYRAAYISNAQAAYGLARVLGSVGLLPTSRSCLHAFLRFQCSQLFRSCNLSLPFALPRAPCYDSCNQLSLEVQDPSGALTCRDMIRSFITSPAGANQSQAAADAALPSCDKCESGCVADFSAPYIYGNASFPVYPGGQSWDFGFGAPIPVQCAQYPIDLFVQSGNGSAADLFPCFKPWVRAPDSAPGYCGIGCPVQLVPLSTYNGVATMTGVFAWSSYIITLLVGATMLCIPRYRRFPGCMILMCCIGSHILAFAFVFLITRGYRRTICKDSITWHDGRGAGACVFQTLTLLWGSMLTATSWAATAVNAMISIGFRKDRWFKSRAIAIVQLVACFGWPTIACIIALGVGKFSGSPVNLICFVIGDPTHFHKFGWDFVCAYGPIGVCILIAVPCIFYTLIAMRHLQDEKSSRIARHVRVVMFLIFFLALWVFAFAYRFYAQVRAEGWGAHFEQTYVRPALLGPAEEPGGHVPNRGLFYGSYFVYAVQGTLIGLLFGSNKDVITFWHARFRNLRQGRSFFSGLSGGSGSGGATPERSMRNTSNPGSSNHIGGTVGGTYT